VPVADPERRPQIVRTDDRLGAVGVRSGVGGCVGVGRVDPGNVKGRSPDASAPPPPRAMASSRPQKTAVSDEHLVRSGWPVHSKKWRPWQSGKRQVYCYHGDRPPPSSPMISKHLLAASGILLFLNTSPPLFADSTFFDGTFNTTDWTSAVAVDTTTAQNASFTAVQMTTGGDPDDYRSMVMTYGNGGYIYVSNVYSAVSYASATDGAIGTINFSYNFEETNPPFAGAAVGYVPLLLQDGVIYEGRTRR